MLNVLSILQEINASDHPRNKKVEAQQVLFVKIQPIIWPLLAFGLLAQHKDINCVDPLPAGQSG